MQQFTVPQFLDVEEHIIGGITVRQFVILVIGTFLIFLSYRLLTFDYFIVVAILLLALVGTLAFLKVNGMPFHYFILNFLQTNLRPSVRVWLKEFSYQELKLLAVKKAEVKPVEVAPLKQALRNSSLSELALIVDTGGAYKGEAESPDLSLSIK